RGRPAAAGDDALAVPQRDQAASRHILRRLMADRVFIFDTTLRDGEQSPGFSMWPGEKLEMARQLARLGVDVIEAGFPISSPGEFDGVRGIAAGVRGPVICGLARANPKDVEAAAEAVRPAERARVHTFIATSPIHMARKLRMDRITVSVHCHNDLGLATANTLAGVAAGARQVEGTINGIGERAGNVALEEVIMTLGTRREAMGYVTRVDTTQIYPTSRLLC